MLNTLDQRISFLLRFDACTSVRSLSADLSMAQYLSPRLSTVRQPRLQMGRDGARHLLERINSVEQGLAGESHTQKP